MWDQGLLEDDALVAPGSTRLVKPRLVLAIALLTTLISVATCAGAILGRPPVGAIPFLVAVCVGGPIFAGWDVPHAVAALRVQRGGKALAKLRRSLAALPETEHPLGF